MKLDGSLYEGIEILIPTVWWEFYENLLWPPQSLVQDIFHRHTMSYEAQNARTSFQYNENGWVNTPLEIGSC